MILVLIVVFESYQATNAEKYGDIRNRFGYNNNDDNLNTI